MATAERSLANLRQNRRRRHILPEWSYRLSWLGDTVSSDLFDPMPGSEMPHYFLERANGARESITSAAYDYLILGTAILGSTSSERIVEWRLSEDLSVRTYVEGDSFNIVLKALSADNRHHPIRVRLANHEGPIPFQIAEARGRALRQVYAMLYTIEQKRLDEVSELLRANWDFDIEELVPPEDRIAIEASAEGSWVVTVKKVGEVLKGAGDAAFIALGAVFRDGRQLILAYARAIVAGKEAQAEAIRFDSVLKQAEARKIYDDSRRLDEAARIDATKQMVELLLRIDREAKPENAELLKKKLLEIIRQTNPEISPPLTNM